MIDNHDDFFVTGKVIDYLNYKSYMDNKDTCSSSIQSKWDIEAGYKESDNASNACHCETDRYEERK